MFPVTGVNLHMITPIVCIVCIFYTTLVSINSVPIIKAGRLFVGLYTLYLKKTQILVYNLLWFNPRILHCSVFKDTRLHNNKLFKFSANCVFG